MSMSRTTPILPCRDHTSIIITPSSPPAHPLQSPSFTVPPSIQSHLETASSYLRAGDTVALPTETVYGLGAHSLDPTATRKVYRIKGRPADNPLIIHISSLDMLRRLLPPTYSPSPLYMALITAFWPGPLSLLFPSPNPEAPPAPQTNAIRMPSHPLALALINQADLPVSAPSANSSGRPSPTQAQHVYNDLNGAEGLGCILDGGDCGVGVESTVVDGLGWKAGGGGYVDVLRPGGLGVEEIARIVADVDGREGMTEIRLHGREWQRNAVASSSRSTSTTPNYSSPKEDSKSATSATTSKLSPSTPGLKYRHYSPRIPVFLLLPSTIFPRPSTSDPHANTDPISVIHTINHQIQKNGRSPRFGLLHYSNSPLSRRLLSSDIAQQLSPVSLGPDATSAAQRLFSGMLQLEGKSDSVEHTAVDAILIEGCSDEGLGLAVMERVGKAVGGGGITGGLDVGEGTGDKGRFWVEV